MDSLVKINKFLFYTVFKIPLGSFTVFFHSSSLLFCLQIEVSVQITTTLTFSFPFPSPATISVSVSFQISQETSLSLSKPVHLSEKEKVKQKIVVGRVVGGLHVNVVASNGFFLIKKSCFQG